MTGAPHHPKYDEIVSMLSAVPRPSIRRIARMLGVTPGVVSGIDYRMKNAQSPPAVDTHGSGVGDWDRKLFEPWSERKARLAKQRRTA